MVRVADRRERGEGRGCHCFLSTVSWLHVLPRRTRQGGVLDTDSDSDFDLDETVALRAEGCSGRCSETLKLWARSGVAGRGERGRG
ncbi:MAG: hypothetical protein RI897_795 [Verrucomicrobiota bacterium]